MHILGMAVALLFLIFCLVQATAATDVVCKGILPKVDTYFDGGKIFTNDIEFIKQDDYDIKRLEHILNEWDDNEWKLLLKFILPKGAYDEQEFEGVYTMFLSNDTSMSELFDTAGKMKNKLGRLFKFLSGHAMNIYGRLLNQARDALKEADKNWAEMTPPLFAADSKIKYLYELYNKKNRTVEPKTTWIKFPHQLYPITEKIVKRDPKVIEMRNELRVFRQHIHKLEEQALQGEYKFVNRDISPIREWSKSSVFSLYFKLTQYEEVLKGYYKNIDCMETKFAKLKKPHSLNDVFNMLYDHFTFALPYFAF